MSTSTKCTWIMSTVSTRFTLIILISTRYTSVEKEELLYHSSTMVAEIGGTLSLFLGVSFMTIWDGFIWSKKCPCLFKAWLDNWNWTRVKQKAGNINSQALQ